MISLAGNLEKSELRRAFLGAGRQGLITEEGMEYCRSRSRSFEGRQRLMGLIGAWSPNSGKVRSNLEGEFLLLCGECGIPPPRTNQRVCGYEVDCLWPESKLIVELDGRRYHDDGVAFEADRIKGNVLTGAGYTLLRFTYRMVSARRDEVAESLRAYLGAPTRAR